jgi:hypothetical protein
MCLPHICIILRICSKKQENLTTVPGTTVRFFLLFGTQKYYPTIYHTQEAFMNVTQGQAVSTIYGADDE